MFRTEKIADGVQLHILPTSKFKTVTSKIYVQTALGAATGLTALLPMVMARGSEEYPTMQEVAAQLADLYGARFGCDVAKIGERQCMEFYYELPAGAYVEEPELVDRGMATFAELILRPKVDGDGFDPLYVEQEKLNLKNLIRGLIDDKRSYALQRFYQNMFAGEPFAVYKYGTVEEVEPITPEELLGHYRRLMSENPMDIFVVGDVDEGSVVDNWTRRLGERNGVGLLPPGSEYRTPKEVKQVQEEEDLQQGILFLGYRTPVTYSSPDYYKLLVYSGVLGGFPHSKLFINVREKASLAYYVWTHVEATKGFMLINAGIHPDNYQKAVDIILEQVEAVNQGDVSSQELKATKMGLINNFLTMEDNPMAVIDRGMLGNVHGVQREVEEAVDRVREVSVDDLVEQGQRLKLDTVYFLRGPGGSFSGGQGSGQEVQFR
ncbi:MAG: insulinase family protein [Firmicutes bacterium]|nr:insulinase family protein [Bacillota bacterium]